MEERKFPWGRKIQTHVIGTHEIIEFVSDCQGEDHGKTMFSTGSGIYCSLEEAMLGVVCDKYQPFDCLLYGYVAKLIGIPEEKNE